MNICLSQRWNNELSLVCRHVLACLKWNPAGVWCIIPLMNELLDTWIYVELLASVNTMLTSYRRTKYINTYKTYICLQCFATTMRLQCVFWSSTCVLLTRTRPDRSCIYLNFIMLLPSKQTNKKRHTVLNPSSLHLRWSQKFWPIKSSFYIWKRLRYTTKDFPGGCKRLKQILFIVLEWKKKCIKCYLTGTREPAPKCTQLKVSVALPLV